MLRYALGIDGGGSKCDAVLIAEDGTVVGWGRGGPTHAWYDPLDVIVASFADAVRAALAGVEGAELWVAGAPHWLQARGSADPTRDIMTRLRNGQARLAGDVHIPDAEVATEVAGEIAATVRGGEVEVAYASARRTWGLIVLAGTGSFVHLRTADGRDRHAGGMGPVLGDYGSGYDIALRGMRAAFASPWASSRRTSLQEAVPAALECDDLRDVFRLVYDEQALSRRRTAALARVVDREAEAGDEIARRCIREGVDALADLAIDLIHDCEVEDTPLPVIASGSVAQNSRLWWERLCERIEQVVPEAEPIIPTVRPVVGAALLALEEMGVEVTDALMERIIETQQEHLHAAQAQLGT